MDMRLYKNLMGAISAGECSEFWGKVKKWTASGRSRLPVDMVVCLSAPDLKLMRRLVNLVLILRVSEYMQWKERITTPVHKEEGNFNLERARPLVLLEMLPKAF